MDWAEMYTRDREPTDEEIAECVAKPQWGELLDFVEGELKGKLKHAYSGCSMQKGWNIKCIKKSKPLCTLYPQMGFFRALVTVSDKIAPQVEPLLPLLSERTQAKYRDTPSSMGSKWLMLTGRDNDEIEDIRRLIQAKAAAI